MHGMGQSNQALLRLMDAVANELTPREEEPFYNTLQSTTTVRRRFQILIKHREEAIARSRAEAVVADLFERYPGQVYVFSGGAIRELFLNEGFIWYAINGEIEAVEAVITLPDGMCLGYEESPSIPDQTARAAESGRGNE